MDARGARALVARIELDHWCRAEGVRHGRQDARDPDAERLLEVGDGFRRYEGGGEKRLVDGAWTPAVLARSDAAA